MSVVIAGCWEQGWQTPSTEYDLWIHPLREFGVDEIHMYPISGIGINKSRVKEYTDLSEVLALYPDHDVVFVDEAGTTELHEFVHPENVIYVFGRTGFSPMKTMYDEAKHKSIKVASKRNSGGFWSHQVAAMIMYDRFFKGA